MTLTLKSKSNLRFAINLGNSVLACRREQGHLGGISVALAEKLAQHLGLNAELLPYNSAGSVVRDASMKEWDIAFLAIDPLRQNVLRFTQPYLSIEGTIMVPENSRIKNVEQIDHNGNVINVEKGAAYDLFLTRHLKNSILQRYATSEESIDMFVFGQGDMVAGIRQELTQRVAEDKRFRVLPDSFTQIRHAICVPLDNINLFNTINDILTDWLQQGLVDSLIQQHVKTELQ